MSELTQSWDWHGKISQQNFQRNCQVLAMRAPELAAQLQVCPLPPNSPLGSVSNEYEDLTEASVAASIRAGQSRDGNWILYLQNKPLHSRYRPLDECKKWISGDLRKETNAAIFAGFGLGYQIEEFLSRRSKAIILLIENSYSIFKAALCLRDLRDLLANPQFFCSVGPAANLELYLHHFSERNFQFYQLQALYHSYHKFYQPLQKRILNLLSRFRINTNTLNRFGQLWVRNMVVNLHKMPDSIDAGIFYQHFEGLPFLLIAAGPSLEQHLPILRQLQQRFVLLSVDTALSLLLEQAIEPDFVLSVDPQLLNARHFDGCESPNTILVSESCIYPAILQRRWRSHALFHSNFPLMERIEAKLGGTDGRPQFAPIRSGGSVATAAWDFARNCKASALYVIGLDLSYPTLRSHCPGTLSQHYSLIQGKRLQPMEQLNWRVTVAAGAGQVESWQGAHLSVLSDKRMNVYRNWLEESLKNIPDWPNYAIDGSEGRAARIKGMQLISLEEALAEPERRPQIESRIQQILRKTLHRKQHYQILRVAIEELLAEVRDIYRWSAELLALLCYQRRSNGQEKHLQVLQSKIAQSPCRSIISFLFTDTLSQVVGRSPEQEAEGQLERDRLQIYQRFYLSSKFHLYWLSEAQRQCTSENPEIDNPAKSH